MTPDELRAAARALYEARADDLALDDWRPGAWRDGAPSAKQRATLARVAGSTLAQLEPAERETVRAVAVAVDAAGKGAVSDCLAVAIGSYARERGDRPPARQGGQRRSGADRRLDLVAAVLEADDRRLDAVARALGER